MDQTIKLEELAEQQGVAPVTDFTKLLGSFWPEEEKADAFIAQVKEWRGDSLTR